MAGRRHPTTYPTISAAAQRMATHRRRRWTIIAQRRPNRVLSKATLNSTFRNLRAFFQWLAEQQGYQSKLSYSDADYFSLSGNDARIAMARRETPVPTLEQIAFVLAAMPTATDTDRRNRALLAFTILTGSRDGAMTP